MPIVNAILNDHSPIA